VNGPPAARRWLVAGGARVSKTRQGTVVDTDNADLFEWDLGPDNLGPGTWVVAFTTPAGKILASGYLVVTP